MKVAPIAFLALIVWPLSIRAAEEFPWPPQLPGVVEGAISLETDEFLKAPELTLKEGEFRDVPFVVAKTPPKVDLYFHGDLGPNAAMRQLWSTWGDSTVASDGRVYVSIGDHGSDKGGDARCFVYCFDPETKKLERVVDMNEVVPPKPGRVSWSKLHAGLHEAADGKIYFSATLNDSMLAGKPEYHWDEALPAGQLYQYDPATGKTIVFLTLPPAHTVSESLFHPKFNRWWCNLEGGGPEDVRLWGVDLATKKVYEAPKGSMALRRAFAMAKDGSVFFNSDSPEMKQFRIEQAAHKAAEKEATAKAREERTAWKQQAAEAKSRGVKPPPVPPKHVPKDPPKGPLEIGRILKWDATTDKLVDPGIRVEGSSGMHVNPTRESSDGNIYGVLWTTAQLFRLSVKDNKLTTLGDPWQAQNDSIHVIELSPDERYLYYLPGGHGGGRLIGTPVIQYEIATGQRKVLAYLGPAFAKACGYTPAGTYGIGLSKDGSKLYVNFNGSPDASYLPPGKKEVGGFGLTSFAVIHIPESERK